MKDRPQTIAWIDEHQPFPPIDRAWSADSPAPGLLCAGSTLSPRQLQAAYRRGIFPWFSPGQPVLWWSPDPRMVLSLDAFRLRPALRKTLRRFIKDSGSRIQVDTAFEQVIRACAHSPRAGQQGTWIVPTMVNAYCALHEQGLAHSVETWVDGQLVGGLYCVAIGKAVFGESMFYRQTDASKIALAALVALCRSQGVIQIDCQQETRHLASFGAAPCARSEFLRNLPDQLSSEPIVWEFLPLYWSKLMKEGAGIP